MRELLKKFRFRKAVLALADIFILVISALIANFLLELFNCGAVSLKFLVATILSRVICCHLCLSVFNAYNHLWRYFNAKDYISCIIGVSDGMLIAGIMNLITQFGFEPLYTTLHWSIATIGICLFRYAFKQTFIELTKVRQHEGIRKRTMIIGGGQACKMLLKELESANDSPVVKDVPFEPVCIIDDNRFKIGSKVQGIEIVGSSNEIPKFVESLNIEQIIFAIPSAIEEERKRVLDICAETKLPIKIIPFLSELMFDDRKKTLLSQIRNIKTEELLGRDPIKFDNQNIRSFINNKICMVTGGGGSIGSELVRQIAKYDPAQIIIVDIYENNAYDIQQELTMQYKDSLNLVTLIASVRDYDRMNQIFEKYKPDIVFHAAAHKHVPLMEVSPMEAIKNNVMGTFNVATLAQFHNVKKFVMISTDKAVNPTNVMGASKRCCEMIVQYLSQQHEGITEFVTTRFGNVLGSNGSVIPLFKRQIENGLPVTVTHPDIIRYFMTIPEAVSLVMEAAAIAHGSEIFVLDMGQPVKIVTLAENLIRMYGKEPYKDVPIKFVGLRPGEKIKEELLMNEEGLQKTENKLIFIGKQTAIDDSIFPSELYKLCDAAKQNNEELAVQALKKIVPTFITPEEFNKNAITATA